MPLISADAAVSSCAHAALFGRRFRANTPEFMFPVVVSGLVDGYQDAGSYVYNFDAGSLAGGVYMYSLEYDGQVLQRSMQLIK